MTAELEPGIADMLRQLADPPRLIGEVGGIKFFANPIVPDDEVWAVQDGRVTRRFSIGPRIEPPADSDAGAG